MNPLQFSRHENALNRRLQLCRRPIVEALEGRQLQSGIVGSHIGMGVVTPAIQGAHIGMSVVAPAVQGAHIGMGVVAPAVQGAHIGMGVVTPAILFPVFAQ
jgi:hypothetical protein